MTIVAADTGWMLISSALVLLMVPGLALFYGGLVQRKNVLSSMMHSFVAMGVIAVEWVVIGYSLAFSPGNSFIGGLDHVLLRGIDPYSVTGTIPTYAFIAFQGMFAIITPALISGAIVGRIKFKSYIAFILLWGIIVYAPICHWVWGGGFLTGKALDFAGGTVVHIASGVSGLVIALYLGARRGYPTTVMNPSNIVMTLMGAGLLWVGWFGFNAGSAVSSGILTAQALTATQAAAAAGAITWMLIEMIHNKKATAIGFASGILAGLVAVTPAAGVVQPIGAITLGFAASIICYLAIQVKGKLGYDDSLDAFGVHGIGGITGSLLLTFFIRKSWLADATVAKGSEWGVFDQLGVQATAVGIAIAYSALLTIILVVLINKTIGFKSSAEEEMKGMDSSYHGEKGYGLLNLS